MKTKLTLFLCLLLSLSALAVPGWTFLGAHNGHTYYRSNTAVAGTAIDVTVTAFRTATALTAAQAYAVAMDNSAENAAVTALRNNYNTVTYGSTDATSYDDPRNVWIGYTDRVTEGAFKWINGQTTSYTNWLPGEPNDNSGNEDYVQLIAFNTYSGMWNDMPGTTLLPLIVEVVRPFALAMTAPVLFLTKQDGAVQMLLSQPGTVERSTDGLHFYSLGHFDRVGVDRSPALQNYYRLEVDGRYSIIYFVSFPPKVYTVYNMVGQLIERTCDVSRYLGQPYVIL